MKTRMISAFIVVALAVGACGDDGPTGTNSGTLLNAAELAAFFDFLFDAFDDSEIGLDFSSTGQTINVSAPCTGGGSISATGNVTGDIDASTATGNIEAEETFSWNSCQVTTTAGDFTINGEVLFTFDITLNGTASPPTGTLGLVGGFGYTGAKSGSCAVDVTVTVTSTSATSTGSVCGVPANQFVDLTDF